MRFLFQVASVLVVFLSAMPGYADGSTLVNRGSVILNTQEDPSTWLLQGDWAFWPGKLISDIPQPPSKWVDEAPLYYKVPGSLTRELLVQHQVADHPFGTFALRIAGLSDFEMKYIEVFLGPVSSASRVHIVTNAWESRARVDYNGTVSKLKRDERPYHSPKYFEVNVEELDSVYLLVEFSFHNDSGGGFFATPRVFYAPDGTKARLKDFAADAAMSGILILFALFHLVLYSRRRKDTPSLWFGFFCFAMGIRLLAMSEVYDIFLSSDFAVRAATSIEYSAISLGGVFGACFVLALVPGQLYKFAVFGLAGVGTILTAVAVLREPVVVTSSLSVYQGYAVIVLTIVVGHLVGNLKRSVNARYALLGMGLLFAAVINDLLHANEVIQTDYVVPVSVILFVLVQSGLIGRNNARVFAERDRAQTALLENYQKLDEELLRRESLLEANEQLKRENLEAAEQLVAADKLATLGTVVAGVAHDIANPTGLISNSNVKLKEGLQELQDFLEELVGEPEDDESRAVLSEFRAKFAALQERVVRIELGAKRIETINLAIRNQARQDKFEKDVLLRPIVEECIVVLGQRLKDIEVRVECEPTLALDCKRSEMGQVMMNLMSNAADAIADCQDRVQAEILVKAESVLMKDGEPMLKLSVSDSGPGIPTELVSKVLEPFYTTKSVGVGTGLGMSIVSKIVNNHQGKVTIENCRELGGAAILIVLPQRGVYEAEV